MTDRQPRFLTARQAAELLEVSYGTVVKWANEGVLPCSRFPEVAGSKLRRRRFLRSDIEAFLRSMREGAA